MSSYALYERYYTEEQPGVRKRNTFGQKSRKHGKDVNLNRLFSVLILFLLLVLAGELIFHLIITPRLVLRRVTVSFEGHRSLRDDEILHIAGLEGVVSYLGLQAKVVEERLTANPMIHSASVTKKFPDGLTIHVVSRAALASVLAVSGGQSIPLCVDSEGYILSAAAVPAGESMPVISGVRLVDLRPGMRFPDELVSYLGQLAELREAAPELYNLISEIKFVKKSTASYEVVLFPGHARLRVRTGPELSVEMLRSILLVIDVVKQQGMLDSLAELDFRTGEVVYRSRRG